MNRLVLFSVLLLSGFWLPMGCTDSSRNKSNQKEELPAFDLKVAKKGIEEANLEFVNFFNKNDSVGLANMFTLDGESMEPNEPLYYGRARIQAHYSHVMKAGTNKLALVTIGLWGTADLLVEEGEYTITNKEDKQLDKGKYIVLWKVEDGTWKIFRDCYNSNLAVQALK